VCPRASCDDPGVRAGARAACIRGRTVELRSGAAGDEGAQVMTAVRERASALMRLTLVEACEAVRKGEVTSVALTEAALDAFKAGDRTINASIALEPEEALQTAERLDRLRKAGQLLGPLHGVPLAHKDMYYRTGKPCRCGSQIRGPFRPTH